MPGMTSPTDPPPFNYRPPSDDQPLRDPHAPLDPTTWCTVHWEPSSECVTRAHDMRVAAEVEVLPSPTALRRAMTLATAEKLRTWWPGQGRELLRDALGREPRDGDEFTLFGVPMRWRAPLVPLHRFLEAGEACTVTSARLGAGPGDDRLLRCTRRAGHDGSHLDRSGASWTFSGGLPRVSIRCEATKFDSIQRATHHCKVLNTDHAGPHWCRDDGCSVSWWDDDADLDDLDELPPLRAEGNAILDRDGQVVGLFLSSAWARAVEQYARVYSRGRS